MQTQPQANAGGTVDVEKHGAVTVLKLNYPQRRNALSLPLREKLGEGLRQAIADPDCRVIVLFGDGGHFCSGGDITSFEGVTPINGRVRMRKVHDEVVRLMVSCEKPIIAAVEGHAAGAGMCIAANCDIVVASSEAKFTCSFNKIGLLPDLGGLWSIPQRIGMGRAKLLMMTGRMIDAATAQSYGLVEEICSPGQALQSALALAQEISQVAPLTNGLVKAVFARGPLSFDQVLSMETDMQGLLYSTEDFQEGRKAFLEKRKPSFLGR